MVNNSDTMTFQQKGKASTSMEQAIEELHRCSGSQFDGDVVKYFTKGNLEYERNTRLFKAPEKDCGLHPAEIENTMKPLDEPGMK
ncbi:hypothetical protein JWG39_06335 [Desulforhopalus vacuolatus]|uniref:hypothetical protein n=1 Tax=Desulforhopalus vacuolatus TaxID=40414 RepID=UPI001963641E|nr:hypothetical protein [Desulforhopalus vacuolatus]MBM9519436.1 hypothetical protein [Desulforhopalus vacuolatus]